MICEFCRYEHDNEGDRYGCPNCCGGDYEIEDDEQENGMRIINANGLYIATFKHRSGAICMGYAPTRTSALLFCVELIEARDAAS